MAPAAELSQSAAFPNLDWALARVSTANVLVVGSDRTVWNFMCALRSRFAAPIVECDCAESLALPSAADPVGTLVLHGVDTLTMDEQRALNAWLVSSARKRVVSTTRAALWPMVKSRQFSEELYYRLNVLLIDPAAR
jgi:hypothetical protein